MYIQNSRSGSGILAYLPMSSELSKKKEKQSDFLHV